ncbi:MAG: HEPN domain-containing protein [Prevotella sp.]|mgnify:CR=1 FL=1|nr:HEPN domain-containing protein [Prevotella sp.]
MSLKEIDRQILITLELDKSDKTWEQMQVQVNNNVWEMAANRLYYSLFHAVSALLITDRHEVGTHRGAVNQFHLYYIKTSIFTKDEGRLYSTLQKLREDGDYNCYIDVEQKDVESNIEPTRQLIQKIKQYIAEKTTQDRR